MRGQLTAPEEGCFFLWLGLGPPACSPVLLGGRCGDFARGRPEELPTMSSSCASISEISRERHVSCGATASGLEVGGVAGCGLWVVGGVWRVTGGVGRVAGRG